MMPIQVNFTDYPLAAPQNASAKHYLTILHFNRVIIKWYLPSYTAADIGPHCPSHFALITVDDADADHIARA